MYQPPGGFQKIVAIDWSGAERPINTRKIQVAEYVPADGTVSLVGCPGAYRWSRESVVEYVERAVNAVDEGPVLIGFDFAFAYPYCDKDPGTYFRVRMRHRRTTCAVGRG